MKREVLGNFLWLLSLPSRFFPPLTFFHSCLSSSLWAASLEPLLLLSASSIHPAGTYPPPNLSGTSGATCSILWSVLPLTCQANLSGGKKISIIIKFSLPSSLTVVFAWNAAFTRIQQHLPLSKASVCWWVLSGEVLKVLHQPAINLILQISISYRHSLCGHYQLYVHLPSLPLLEPHIFRLAAPAVQSLNVQRVALLPPVSHKTARAANVALPTLPSSLLYQNPSLWLLLPNLGQTRPSSLRSNISTVSPPLTHLERVLSQLLLSPVLNQVLVTAETFPTAEILSLQLAKWVLW